MPRQPKAKDSTATQQQDPATQPEPAAKDWAKFQPHEVHDFESGHALLSYLWTKDRRYSAQDLSILAAARFDLAFRRRIPAHLVQALRRVETQWMHKDRAEYARANQIPLEQVIAAHAAGELQL